MGSDDRAPVQVYHTHITQELPIPEYRENLIIRPNSDPFRVYVENDPVYWQDVHGIAFHLAE